MRSFTFAARATLRAFVRGGSVVLAMLLIQAGARAPLGAQAYRYGAGWTIGVSDLTALNPDPASASSAALDPEVGVLVGLYGERAYGSDGRFSVRYQGTYLQPQFQWSSGERTIDAISADVSVLIRLGDPTRARGVQPYLMGGLGGMWYDLGRGPATTYAAADAYHNGESGVLPLAAFGAGADFPFFDWDWDGSPVRVRLELGDQMTFGSPLRRASDQQRYGPVHDLRFSIGLLATVEPIR